MLMKKLSKIAIQGQRASFHDMAAREYLSCQSVEIVECKTFKKSCEATVTGDSDLTVMAIENTLVGSILSNYALMQEYSLSIIGEVYLPIIHHLMALPGQMIKDIKIVRSHPMALMQCSDFLEKHPWLVGEKTTDTAGSAMQIRDNRISGVCSIGSEAAARVYRLEVLAKEIQDLEHNYTRFLILSKLPHEDKSKANKASISLRVKHEAGGLAKVLDVFRKANVNMTLIQSISLPDQPHEYAFHIDLEFESVEQFRQAMIHVSRESISAHILGIYNSGARPYDSRNKKKTAGIVNTKKVNGMDDWNKK